MNHLTSLNEQLRSHVESHYPILLLSTFEEHDADALIRSTADGRRILEWDLARGNVDFSTKRPLAEHCDLAAALDLWLRMDLENHLLVIKDAHLALRDHPLTVARLKALALKIVHDPETVATVILVTSQPLVPPELEKFITLFELPLPDEEAILGIVNGYANACEQDLPPKEAQQLVQAFRGLSKHEIHQLLNRGYQHGGSIGAKDVRLVLDEKEQVIRKSGILEMVRVSEKIDDVGGLDKLKEWLGQKARVLADLNAATAFGVEPPKGMLIAGMPGCGKSMTAKATAALFGLPLLRLDVGSLMGKYVGESEANMRRALKQADAVSPCVLWIDELEKAFVGIGSGAAGSEVSSRLFGYFLTWMQEKTSSVFVVATANDISVLPPELLRKGRFDEIFYVGFPNLEERAEIFRLHLNRRSKAQGRIDMQELAAKSDGFSGADIEAVVKEAVERAFVANVRQVTQVELEAVIAQTASLSVTMKDTIKKMKDKFEQSGIKPASSEGKRA